MDAITKFLRDLSTGAGAGRVAGADMGSSLGRNAGALAGVDANALDARRWLEEQQALAGLDEMQRYPGPVGPGGGTQAGADAAANMAFGPSPFDAVTVASTGGQGSGGVRYGEEAVGGGQGLVESPGQFFGDGTQGMPPAPGASMLLGTPLGRKEMRDGWQPGPDMRAAQMAVLREVLSRG